MEKGNELLADLTTKEGRDKIAEFIQSLKEYEKGEYINQLVQQGAITISQAIEILKLNAPETRQLLTLQRP